MKDPLLFRCGQPRIQRQDVGLAAAKGPAAQRLRRLENFPLGRHKQQHVPRSARANFMHRVRHPLQPIRFVPILVDRRGPIQHLDRIHASRDFQHRDRPHHRTKVGRKSFGINRGRRDNHLQITSLRNQTMQVPEQKVDIQGPLVRFIDNNRIVIVEKRPTLRFRQQNSVRHQLDMRLLGRGIGKTDFKADFTTDLNGKFFGDARGDRTSGDPAGLCVSDGSGHTPSQFEADFGKLRRLPRTGLATDHDDLMVPNRGSNLVFAQHHRERIIKRDLRHPPLTLLKTLTRSSQVCMESFKPLIRCRGRGRTGLKCARLSRTGFRGLGIPPPIRFDVAESTPLLAQAMTVDQHGLGQR